MVLKIQNRDSSYIETTLRSPGGTLSQTLKRDGRRIASGICDLLKGAVGGVHGADLWVAVPGTNSVLGTRTVTCTQATSAGSTVTFACGTLSIVLTEGVDFLRGASDTTEALALSNAVAAHAVLGALFTPVPAAGVLTLTHKMPGRVMDDWTVTGSTGLVIAAPVLGTEGTAKIALRNVPLNHTP